MIMINGEIKRSGCANALVLRKSRVKRPDCPTDLMWLAWGVLISHKNSANDVSESMVMPALYTQDEEASLSAGYSKLRYIRNGMT